MNKKALSTVVASVLLIVLALIATTLVYSVSRETIIQFSPPTDIYCRDVEFKAEIFQRDGNYYFAGINRANIAFYGFEIKKIAAGTQEMKEKVELKLQPGNSG